MSTVAERLAEVRQQIAAAAADAGRNPAAVQLCAVSKTFPADVIREAMDAGQTLFGESRAQ